MSDFTFDLGPTQEHKSWVKVSERCCFTSALSALTGIWPLGASEERLGLEEAVRVLDELRFFSAAKKDVGLKLSLQLSAERGLGSGRMGEGTSWRVSLGEADSGDPPGVRRAEQVSAKAGADLSAAAGVKNKHRCSHSWLQMLDREE